MSRFYLTEMDAFKRYLEQARSAMPERDRLQVSPIDMHTAYESFWTVLDGSAGFAIEANGTLSHLFKHPASQCVDVMTHALRKAKQQGATRLEAFDTYLVKAYAKRGAREISRNPFIARFAPKGWNYGKPDYVVMAL